MLQMESSKSCGLGTYLKNSDSMVRTWRKYLSLQNQPGCPCIPGNRKIKGAGGWSESLHQYIRK